MGERTPEQPPAIINCLHEWLLGEKMQSGSGAIDLSFRQDASHGTWSASVEGETEQRIGYLTVWESGELDCQVIRRADDLLVLNEHRFVREPDDVLDALRAFRLVLVYVDPRE